MKHRKSRETRISKRRTKQRNKGQGSILSTAHLSTGGPPCVHPERHSCSTQALNYMDLGQLLLPCCVCTHVHSLCADIMPGAGPRVVNGPPGTHHAEGRGRQVTITLSLTYTGGMYKVFVGHLEGNESCRQETRESSPVTSKLRHEREQLSPREADGERFKQRDRSHLLWAHGFVEGGHVNNIGVLPVRQKRR